MGKQTLPFGVEGGDPKDQERAASMANEGGAAGASMDTQEQFADTSDQYASAGQYAAAGRRTRLRKKRRMPWMWGAAAASAAIGGVALARTIADRRTRASTTITEVETGTASGGRKRRASKSAGSTAAAASSGRTNGRKRGRRGQQGERAQKGKTARGNTQRSRTGARKTGGGSSRQASAR
jgi:hypothetical protein